MVLLQRAGAAKVGFLTDPEPAAPAVRKQANGTANGIP
jgi:hypothetical protein